MMEWFGAWGASFVFKTILEQIVKETGDLATEAGKDFVKDFFKDSLKKGISRFNKDDLTKAMVKAYAQFLYIIQQELEGAGCSPEEIEGYRRPLERLIHDKAVKEWLGKAFEPGCQGLEPTVLRETWERLELKALPDDFNWTKISRLYLKRVGEIIGESRELKELFIAKKTGETAENTKQIAGIIPDYDLERYRESIQETYRHLKLSKLDSTYRSKSYEVKLWKIFIPQTVREALPPSRYDLPPELRERLQEEGALEADFAEMEYAEYRQLFREKPSKSVLDVVKDEKCPYTVFLGDPGSGKSTLLQYLALDWAENPTERIPLLIELRDYARDENSPRDFLGFFHEGKRKICELNQLQLDEQLKSGQALVMFDGLDEIFNNDIRGRVIKEIHAFSNKYPGVRIIVTSRVFGYSADELTDAGFRHFTLEEFDNRQIREFIKRWHSLALPDESPQDRLDIQKRLQTAIKDSPAIRQLAGNPLLLTMMAILNRYKELPRRRIDLYEESTNVLLYQWEIEYKKMELTLDDVDLRAKQEMLRQIAYRMQASNEGLKGNIIHRDDLEEEIYQYYCNRLRGQRPRAIAGQIIEQLRKRDFILCQLGKDYYGFVHRTFLEYFCAMAFIEKFNKRGKEGGLDIDELKSEVFGKHWQDEKWHEVLRLIAGSLNEFVGDIIDYLIDIYEEIKNITPLILAAECLGEVDSKVKLEIVSNRLLQALQEALKTDEDSRKIARTITRYWKDEAGVMAWLEKIVIDYEKSSDKQGIAQGIADIKLPRKEEYSYSITSIADIYYEQHQYEKAISVYLYLKISDQSSIFNMIRLGQAYVKIKQFDEAINYYKKCLATKPDYSSKDSLFYTMLGSVYAESGSYQEAEEAIDHAIELGDDPIFNLTYFWNLGNIYQDWGKYGEAISAYQQALDIHPSTHGVYADLARVYKNLGQYDKAISDCNRAIEMFSDHEAAYNNLGCLYRIREQWEEAIDAFQSAIELNYLYSDPYRNLGLVYLLQNDFTQAEQAFKNAIQINAYDGKAFLDLGIMQALQGDLERAKNSWREGLKLYSEYAQYARLYRAIYTIALGDTQQGLNTLQQIIEEEKPPAGLLRRVLEIARLLQGCPRSIAGIDEAVNSIERAMNR